MYTVRMSIAIKLRKETRSSDERRIGITCNVTCTKFVVDIIFVLLIPAGRSGLISVRRVNPTTNTMELYLATHLWRHTLALADRAFVVINDLRVKPRGWERGIVSTDWAGIGGAY